ncbi:hypothetical protein PYS58_12550 [Chryseobacterium indologenes]|uniref:hypothetical protein n=1 Tax=Chryseobacterium indologenes TaxID=253 RepID=UPI0023E8D7C3|nr:hypothetical protein [Chryseobacterium indologenes]WET47415.1 hypothetical protein PYS58_12550 [Chryseobacterium indologenes]
MDSQNIYNQKLTPSAKEAINEIVNEFENLLITKAFTIAQNGKGSDKEISLRDILEAKDQLMNIKKESIKEDYKRKRLMTLITLTGALYSIIGLFIYMYQNNNISLENNLGLLVAFTGILTIFGGFVYTQYLTRKNELIRIEKNISISNFEDDFDIIRKWQIIEKLGSNLMRQNGYNINESRSINDILKFLSNELQSNKLYIDLRELLLIRNKIVHEGTNLSKNERLQYLNKANKIIESLEKLEK